VGAVERVLRDRAADALGEINGLDVRPMFSGYGFYADGRLVAAAWDGRFRLRLRQSGRWVYHPVADELLDQPPTLIRMIRERAGSLSVGDQQAAPAGTDS
jgi:hypothetical protein